MKWKPSVYVDYGNGNVRGFSRGTIRRLRRHLHMRSITLRQLREVAREWAESIPPMSRELNRVW